MFYSLAGRVQAEGSVAYWKALVRSAATAVCQSVLEQDARPKFLLVACVRMGKTEHTERKRS